MLLIGGLFIDSFYQYSSRLLNWNSASYTIDSVPVKQTWRLWVNECCHNIDFDMTKTNQSIETLCIFDGIYYMWQISWSWLLPKAHSFSTQLWNICTSFYTVHTSGILLGISSYINGTYFIHVIILITKINWNNIMVEDHKGRPRDIRRLMLSVCDNDLLMLINVATLPTFDIAGIWRESKIIMEMLYTIRLNFTYLTFMTNGSFGQIDCNVFYVIFLKAPTTKLRHGGCQDGLMWHMTLILD